MTLPILSLKQIARPAQKIHRRPDGGTGGRARFRAAGRGGSGALPGAISF